MKTALTIAGSDSSGGAGIQADIKTMITNGVYAMSAVTALTAQNTTGVTGIMDVTGDFLRQQLDAVFTDIYPDAVKIGMVSQSELIEAIAEKILPEQPAPVLTLSLQTNDLRNVKIPLNYILKLELPEADGTSWHIDTNEEIIKPVSSQKQNDVRIIEFLSVTPGTTKLYLDNQTDDRRCLQSRILRIRVTP